MSIKKRMDRWGNEEFEVRHIVAFGDCFNGLTFRGPFKETDEAEEYAEEARGEDEEWHVLELEVPKAKPDRSDGRETFLELIETIARMRRYMAGDTEFYDVDDAVETMNQLIASARNIVGHDRKPEDEPYDDRTEWTEAIVKTYPGAHFVSPKHNKKNMMAFSSKKSRKLVGTWNNGDQIGVVK